MVHRTQAIELLIEEILIDSDYREDVVDWAAEMESTLKCRSDATPLLSQMVQKIEDQYDYATDTGEYPWNGAGAWVHSAKELMR